MPKYTAMTGFHHDDAERIGVLLVNLGTPDAPTTGALYGYLREFLSDPRVVELPRLLWLPILYGIILNIRPRRSAHKYRKIWTPDGSPLLAISLRQRDALQASLQRSHSDRCVVALAMRYGRPSVENALTELRQQKIRKLLVLPLYPQYSASTTGSTFDAVAAVLRRWRWVPAVRFIDSYHDHPRYISALAQQVQEQWRQHGKGERLLMSYHGVPKRYLLAGDPYHCQCQKTARLLAEELQLSAEQWQVVFQSRFGREEWLQPYCGETLNQLAAQGVRSIDIMTPGFAADCLETLEEVNDDYREQFLDAGGERFNFISCLNDRPDQIELLRQLVTTTVADWLDRPAATPEQRALTAQRARALGAGQ